jgi:hypothetical protein
MLSFFKDNHVFLVLLLSIVAVFVYLSNRITDVDQEKRPGEYIKATLIVIFVYSMMLMVYNSEDISEPMLHGSPDF